MIKKIRFATELIALVTLVSMMSSIAFAQGTEAADKVAKEVAKSANPELIGQLTKELNITPKQAQGGAGAILGLAKTKMNPADFTKLSGAVPGMDGLLKGAPKMKAVTDMASIPGASALGGLAPLAGSFQKLGLGPDSISKFMPIMSKFVEGKGGAGLSSAFMDALK